MLYPDRKIQPQSTSLVFIDAHLDNYQFLATGVVNDVEVIILDSTENGLNKITETLQKKITTQNKIEAIHIFSHGSPGSLQLGNTFLNLDSLISAKEQIKQWKTALSKTANVLLYGCNLAANIGGEFVHKLSQILGVNIAASVDLTGSKLLGGNWNLGFTTGKIVAENPLQPEVMASYNSVLATLTVTNNNDSGTGSLREAIASSNSGDTIEFDSSLTNQTITLTSGQLEIDKDLIIDGVNAPELTISGNNNSRVIDLKFTPDFQSTSLTIKNLTIADGRTTAVDKEGAGAGIRTEQTSTLIVENSKFLNNRAGGLGGGAIYSGFRSNATIINSQFENNDASQAIRNSSGQLSEHAGGAILIWSESEAVIQNSEFIDNKGVNGGAINNLLSNLTVENSQFIDNDSTSAQNTNFGYGGAIYTDGASNNDGVTSGTIKISNSSFDGNKGAGQGGGLFLFAYPPDKIIVENSEIINNQLISNSVGDALGGGLRVGNGELTITNTTIANNSALSQGGGLWVGENSPTEIVNSTFSGNRAESADGNGGLGGAITLANNSNTTNITNTTIANNYAGFQGGGVWGGNSNTTLTNTVVAYNVANNGGNDWNINHHTGTQFSDGGGNIQSDELNPDDTKVTAGVILTDPLLADLEEVNNIFIHPLLENSPAIDAGVNGGAPTTDQLGNTRPVDGDNNGSSITDVGAVEFVTASPDSGNNPNNILIVTNNNDDGEGSLRQAIATAQSGDTIVFDSSLANQTITLTSGQLEIDKDLTIDGGNTTDGNNNPTLTISGNNAHRVLETGVQKNVTIRNLTIANGKTTESGAAGNGAGIKTGFESTLTVENSTFENNVTSGEGGGAIWAENSSNTTIINSKFDNNDATAGESERGGGAISTNGFATLTIQNSEFTNNKGINGGAINTPSTALTVENSTFINNDTTAGAFTPNGNQGLGGAIYTDGVSAGFGGDNGSIIIRDSLFENNKGAGAGGAAFLFTYPGDNVVVEDTQVINNSVIFNDQNFAHGGGIRIGTGNSSVGRTTPVQHQITNTTFAGNTAESQGGGLWVQQQPNLTRVNVINSTFSENRTESPDGTVGLGGAITTYSPTTITNTTITNNYAANISGAIHTTESIAPDIEVRNTIFDRNTAGNEFGISQQTHLQLTDRGGNLQYPAVNSDDELVTANIAIGDPNLADLQEVDGFLVHLLEDGSAAIDAGVNTNAPNTDQLGNTRPVDGDNNGSSITDIGAVEFVAASPDPDPGNNPPTDISLDNNSIAENSENGTVVGTLTTTDPDSDDTHTYTLLNDADGRFVLDGDRILVANGSILDFENNTSHTITVRTTDSGEPAESFDEQVTINVTDVDETPVNNNILGTPGSDRLTGTDNGDTFIGLGGNDTYIINNSADIIIEEGNAGIDTAESSITYRLPSNVENLVLTGENIDGSGNSRNNYIAGSDGDNKIVGGRGNDTLLGVGGADTVIGGIGNDILLGGAGNDILEGRSGRDRLNGGAGNDILNGGGSKDKFIFNTNQPFQVEDLGTDVITNFQKDSDKILLDRDTFTAINSLSGEGFSIVEEFEVVSSNTQAETAVGVIVYNETNGNLFYNQNGVANGFGEGGLFANVVNTPELEGSDFQIR